MKEAANMLGFTRNKFLNWLREEKIMLKTNDRNIPSDRYISYGWFKVNYTLVENENFRGVIPIIRMTTKGFKGIEKRLKPTEKKPVEFNAEENLYFDRQVVEYLDYYRKLLDLSVDAANKTFIRVTLKESDITSVYKDYKTKNQILLFKYSEKQNKIWLSNNTLQKTI